MSLPCEQTLDELLSDPIAKLLYTSDGLSEDDVRDIVSAARHRMFAYADRPGGGRSPIGLDISASQTATPAPTIRAME